MADKKLNGAIFIIRPTVIASIVYFGLLSIWWMWILANAEFPEVGATEAHRLISSPEYVGVTLLNAVFFIAFLVDGYKCADEPRALRRAHFVGIGFGFVLLGLVQLGASYGHTDLTSLPR